MSWISELARRSGRGLRDFLAIIGLLEERGVEQESQLAAFRLYHAEFRALLSANNSFLENVAELEQLVGRRGLAGPAYLRRKAVRLITDVHRMAQSINTISRDRYAGITPVFDSITAQLTAALAELEARPEAEDLVLELSALSAAMLDQAGGKMANLGEVGRRVGLPTPDGFTVSASACRLFFEHNELSPLIEREHNSRLGPDDAPRISATLTQAIRAGRIPEPLLTAMLAAYDRLAARLGGQPRLAVRSSALGEDSSLSFAGQFSSVLNVDRDGLPAAYREVLASLFSAEAVHYRGLHNLPADSALMAVGCIAMIDAIASGIIYSNDPNQPEPGRVVIHAVRGLGVTLADGRTSPEEVMVSREPAPAVLTRQSGRQTAELRCREGAGVAEVPVPEELASAEVLTDAEALSLAGWARRLEDHFGGPQDIEWAMTPERGLIVVQSRPLRFAGAAERTGKPIAGYELILAGGDTASPGVGTGPAVHLTEDDDFEPFPEGGVLVAKRSSPKFVRLMSKARAIVTDAGSTTGHMAALARELRVPALLNTRTATAVIAEGAIVTVDAANGFVYAGAVAELEGQRCAPGIDHCASPPAPPLPPGLARIIELIVPLNLTNARSPHFTLARARTLHDLARFIHEKSYEEMFHLGESLGDFRAASYYLDVFLPIDLYIIDLGGGVIAPPRGRKVKRRHLASAPLAALVTGMMHEKIPRFGARPLDVRGFMSLMMRHALTSPEQERTFRDPCYAMVSDVYLNYTARVGYHFGVVDAYCGKTSNKNYISILFRGGAADTLRRNRRAWAIGRILRELGFSVELNRDLVTARVAKTTTEDTQHHLDMIGRLFQFMRQMDLAMTSDDYAQKVADAFLQGDYDLKNI